MTGEITDVLCMALPESYTEDQNTSTLLYASAVAYVHTQYDHLPEDERPTIRFHKIESLITSDAEEAETFQPSHDCEDCRLGTARTREFLQAHPGRLVALANIYYSEVTP